MFSKIYVEITNACNLRCEFCHGTKRSRKFMTEQEFAAVIDKIKPYTNYVYFHILGEPLLHPQLPQLLHIAAAAELNCCITTNGFLLPEKAETLLGAEKLYKLSVSLHSFEANETQLSLDEYVNGVLDVCLPLAAKGTIVALRLWNGGGADKLNGEILHILESRLGASRVPTRSGYKLGERLYLENAVRFEWPDIGAKEQGTRFCMGLRDQLGILCDGTVVPCCLDADGEINLGNIFTQEPDEIIGSARAKAIYDGFSAGKPSEELCRRCGYATRF